MIPILGLLVLALLGDGSGGKWDESPEAYFMTRDEQRAWEAIKHDENEARRFVAMFRARRGPGFEADVQRRVAVVDEKLTIGETKASATVRGKIVMLLGAPAEIKVKHIPKTSGGSTGHPTDTRKGGATDGQPRPSIIAAGTGWVEYTFRYAPNPELGIGPEGWTVVLEANAASGKDRLKHPTSRKRMNEILDAAARATVRVP